jgi:hypothetical protein
MLGMIEGIRSGSRHESIRKSIATLATVFTYRQGWISFLGKPGRIKFDFARWGIEAVFKQSAEVRLDEAHSPAHGDWIEFGSSRINLTSIKRNQKTAIAAANLANGGFLNHHRSPPGIHT